MKVLFTIVCILAVFSVQTFAGVVEYTGRSAVQKEDIRSAQKNSLTNALIGGISKYLKTAAPGRGGAITEDYFIFIKDYTILNRSLENGSVITKVRINIDDMITQDVATHVAKQVNTAVFFTSGLPSFVEEKATRTNISAIMNSAQFSTSEQVAFEQEIIDRGNRSDVETAFLSIGTQYLFYLGFDVKSYTAGESCTLMVDASYVAAQNTAKIIPIIRGEITIDEADSTQCIYTAVSTATETAMTQVRATLIPSPGEPILLQTYTLTVTGDPRLKDLNIIIDDLKKRKYLISGTMTQFFGDEVTFSVESYFSSVELALRINSLMYGSIEKAEVNDTGLSFVMKEAIPEPAEPTEPEQAE